MYLGILTNLLCACTFTNYDSCTDEQCSFYVDKAVRVEEPLVYLYAHAGMPNITTIGTAMYPDPLPTPLLQKKGM